MRGRLAAALCAVVHIGPGAAEVRLETALGGTGAHRSMTATASGLRPAPHHSHPYPEA